MSGNPIDKRRPANRELSAPSKTPTMATNGRLVGWLATEFAPCSGDSFPGEVVISVCMVHSKVQLSAGSGFDCSNRRHTWTQSQKLLMVLVKDDLDLNAVSDFCEISAGVIWRQK